MILFRFTTQQGIFKMQKKADSMHYIFSLLSFSQQQSTRHELNRRGGRGDFSVNIL